MPAGPGLTGRPGLCSRPAGAARRRLAARWVRLRAYRIFLLAAEGDLNQVGLAPQVVCLAVVSDRRIAGGLISTLALGLRLPLTLEVVVVPASSLEVVVRRPEVHVGRHAPVCCGFPKRESQFVVVGQMITKVPGKPARGSWILIPLRLLTLFTPRQIMVNSGLRSEQSRSGDTYRLCSLQAHARHSASASGA